MYIFYSRALKNEYYFILSNLIPRDSFDFQPNFRRNE